MILLRLAWRNIFRNKRRTILSGIAIGIGLGVMIFGDAFMIGMFESMIRSATDSFIGQGQIHADGFRDTLEVEKTVNNLQRVVDGLKNEKRIKNFSLRTQSFAMLTSAANVTSIMLYGIDPVHEKDISEIDEAIKEGTYPGDSDMQQILIGSKTAATLEAGIGDRLVVTVAQAGTGDLSQEMFRVSGIFHFGIQEMDGAMVFIDLKKSQEILGLGQDVHEIALRFHDLKDAGDRSLNFWKKYSQNGNEAIGWKDIMPQMEALLKMSDLSKAITAIIIFSIVGLTIMNTLFMSLYERMFEFGVLRAIGTRPLRMALMILLEGGSLAVISIIIGNAIGFFFSYLFSVYGIDYRGIEFAGTTINELIYPVMNTRQYLLNPLYVFLFTLIAAIYPAYYTARLTPAKAMKRSF